MSSSRETSVKSGDLPYTSEQLSLGWAIFLEAYYFPNRNWHAGSNQPKNFLAQKHTHPPKDILAEYIRDLVACTDSSEASQLENMRVMQKEDITDFYDACKSKYDSENKGQGNHVGAQIRQWEFGNRHGSITARFKYLKSWARIRGEHFVGGWGLTDRIYYMAAIRFCRKHGYDPKKNPPMMAAIITRLCQQGFARQHLVQQQILYLVHLEEHEFKLVTPSAILEVYDSDLGEAVDDLMEVELKIEKAKLHVEATEPQGSQAASYLKTQSRGIHHIFGKGSLPSF